MGGKQSTSAPRMRTYSGSGAGTSGAEIAAVSPQGSSSARARARSLGSFQPSGPHTNSLSIPTSNGALGGAHGASSPDSDSSTPDDIGPFGSRPFTHSLPVQLFALQGLSLRATSSEKTNHLPSRYGRQRIRHLISNGAGPKGIKCPVCSKFVPPDDIECHLVICLTKPRISYNEDVLTEDKGECVICFDDLQQGDTIARLPCLCIYHKGCIDRWFEVNRSCPEHPQD